MRFLVAFVALLGYAAASAILPPLVLSANPGDVEGATIDATVAAQDTVRAIDEGRSHINEGIIQRNTEAVRQAIENNRDMYENSYWNTLAATQSWSAAASPELAARLTAPLAYPYGIRAGLPLAAPLGFGINGIRAW